VVRRPVPAVTGQVGSGIGSVRLPERGSLPANRKIAER
jgi:hypothetical protein